MRIAHAVVIAAALVVSGACSARSVAVAPRVETRDFVSGTRLRAGGWDVDGALVLRDFLDLERGERCAFVEDAQWRIGPGPAYYCLPLRMARHDANSGPFADEKCTVPLALETSAGPATYAVAHPVDSCVSAPTVYRLGRATTAFPWLLTDGVCVHSGTAATTYALSDVVPLESFVRAEERVVPAADAAASGARVAPLVLVASDGTQMTLGGFDRERAEPVRVDEPVGSPPRWVPSRVAFEGAGEALFGDPACSSKLATKIARGAACPITASLVFTGSCAGDVLFHKVGPAVEPSRLRRRSTAGICTPAKAPGIFAFERGEALDPAGFAPAVVVDGGGSRIRRRGFASSTGAPAIVWSELVDPRTNTSCAPAVASDGLVRCLPSASASITLFADASCATQAFARPLTGCERGEPAKLVSSTDQGVTRAFEVTGDAPALFELDGAVCAPFAPVVPSRGNAVREVDAALFPRAADF